MDFSLGPTVDAFREDVRDFLKPFIRVENGVSHFVGGIDAERAIQRGMGERGWLDLDAEGDIDWNMKMFVFAEEAVRHHVLLAGLATTMMVAFTLAKVGTPEQKARYLPGVIAGETRIALGYSEPSGGSDVAAAKVRSRREGDEWVIDGQKQWTTNAHNADYIWLLTRSDPASHRHRGLTLFMLPTSLPGIEIQPIVTMAGERTNAVFFDGVRVSDAYRVGEPDEAWKVLMAALNYEHGGGNVPGRSLNGHLLRLLDLGAGLAGSRDQSIDPLFAERLGRIAIDAEISKLFVYRTSAVGAHTHDADVLGAIAKVFSREAVVRASDALIDMAGAAALPHAGSGPAAAIGAEIQHMFIDAPTGTVVGGSVEIQRSIIAERGLGLPKTRAPAPPKPASA